MAQNALSDGTNFSSVTSARAQNMMPAPMM